MNPGGAGCSTCGAGGRRSGGLRVAAWLAIHFGIPVYRWSHTRSSGGSNADQWTMDGAARRAGRGEEEGGGGEGGRREEGGGRREEGGGRREEGGGRREEGGGRRGSPDLPSDGSTPYLWPLQSVLPPSIDPFVGTRRGVLLPSQTNHNSHYSHYSLAAPHTLREPYSVLHAPMIPY